MANSVLNLRVFDSSGQLFPPGTNVLVTITDGNQKTIVRDYVKSGNIRFNDLPFYDNFGDNYAVVAYVEGYKQAGFHPVKLNPAAPATLDLMLIPNDPVFNFGGLTWQRAKQKMPFLAAGAGETEADAEQHFSQIMETKRSKPLACMMNLIEAMKCINLNGRSPAEFIKQVRWDYKLADDVRRTFPDQDRFFAYCDSALIDAVRIAAAKGDFDAEHGSNLFHPGASLSWKHNGFFEANVQLTFHTAPLDCVPAKGWVTVEPDIDYYKDLGAHAILEVCRNELTGSLTEPADVFVLRWIEHRKRGLADFAPGYTIRAA